jgi:hypothetical protein
MTIDNVTLQGLSAEAYTVQLGTADFAIVIPQSTTTTPAIDNDKPIIYVGQGNTFEMLGSAELTGNYNTGTKGGAAWVVGGSFRMLGAETKIHHNYTAVYGGGVYCEPGDFIMSGEYAEVSENATATGGGVGGVYVEGRTFEMSGNHANIRKNQGGSAYGGGGIHLFSGAAGVMSGAYAEISENYTGYMGGGVYIEYGLFTMSSGKISGNKTTGDRGYNLFHIVNGDDAGGYWAAGSTGYIGSHDPADRIDATVGSTSDVDMWTNGGVAIEGFDYEAGSYGVNLDMWADR